MARFSYGGQALIEGVLMRGRDVIAVALRHPDGRIVWADEKLAVGFRATRWARLPFVRGLVVLYETLVVGTRWLVRSAGVAAVEELGPAARPAPRPPLPAEPGEAPAAEAVDALRCRPVSLSVRVLGRSRRFGRDRRSRRVGACRRRLGLVPNRGTRPWNRLRRSTARSSGRAPSRSCSA